MIPARVRLPAGEPRSTRRSASSGRPGRKVIAGGMSLLPLMKLRLANPERLVDIGRLAELRGVRQLDDGRLAIGALTTYAELADSPAQHYGLLRDALPDIGDVQVRNRGHGRRRGRPLRPGVGPAGGRSSPSTPRSSPDRSAASRSTPPTASSPGAFTTALADDELVTEIRLPGPRDDAGSAFVAAVPARLGLLDRRGRRGDHQGGRQRDHEGGIALTGVGEHAVPGDGRRGGADRQRGHGRVDRRGRGPRHRRGRPSTATSTPTASTGRRWPSLHEAGDRGSARPARLTRPSPAGSGRRFVGGCDSSV